MIKKPPTSSATDPATPKSEGKTPQPKRVRLVPTGIITAFNAQWYTPEAIREMTTLRTPDGKIISDGWHRKTVLEWAARLGVETMRLRGGTVIHKDQMDAAVQDQSKRQQEAA